MHLVAFAMLSNHPSADVQKKNNTLVHQNIHFPFDLFKLKIIKKRKLEGIHNQLPDLF